MKHHPQWLTLGNQPAWLKLPVGTALMAGLATLVQSSPGPVVYAEFLVTLIILIIVLIAQELLRPKTEFEDERPAGTGDFQFVTATEGRPVPIVWGRTIMNAPNVVWYGDIQALPIHESVRVSWFKKEEYISGYQYHMGVQFGLCRGPDVELVRVWLGREQKFLVYDGLISGILSGEAFFDIDEPELHFPTEGGVQATIDFYSGNDGQTANAFLNDAARQLVSPMVTIPNYAGTCHMVVREMTSAGPLASNLGGYLGNSTLVDPWSVELQRFPGIFSGQAAGEHKVPVSTGIDCNPVNIIYEILTDLEWGLGFLPGEIDVGPGSTFLAAADVMATEVNGFSMVLDKIKPATEMIGEVERQMDGILFLGQASGKWEIKLARNDYTIAALPLLDETNSEFSDYARATWEDTTNQLTVKFNKRAENYKESYAVAQDEANIIMQGAGSIATGRIVAGTISYPGCKLNALASQLVWRSLRTRAYPLARATFTVNREFWDMFPGQVFKWTNAGLDIDELPMRIVAIDFGKLTDNKITITAVQDIFQFLGPSFGDPPDTKWNPPIGTVIDYPTDERIAFEMPRALVMRLPDQAALPPQWPVYGTSGNIGSDVVSRIMCAAKRQGPETQTNIVYRDDPSVPTGDFAEAGTVTAFMEIGQLKSNIGFESTLPVSALTIEPAASSQAALILAIAGVNAETLGVELNNIALIGNEFIMFETGTINGSDVDLTNVYRGCFDSVQETHSAGDDVYIFSAGASVMDLNFVKDNVHDLKFLPQSFSSTLGEGSATILQLTMAHRAQRPTPPNAIQYNTAGVNYGTPDLEGDGSNFQDFGHTTEWQRRNHAAADEVQNLLVDSEPIVQTQFQFEIRHTPYSNSDIVFTGSWVTDVTAAAKITRNEILVNSPNTAVQPLQYHIRTRHSPYTLFPNQESRVDLTHLVTPTSTLTGQVAMGKATWSNELPTSYAAVSGNLHTVTLGSAFTVGDVEYRLNGGSWIVVIAAASSTGTFTPSNTDVIELRHTANDGAQTNFVELDDNGAAVAYGIFLS